MRSKRLARLALLTLLLACATVRCQQGPGEEAEDLEEEPKGKGVHQAQQPAARCCPPQRNKGSAGVLREWLIRCW